MDIKMHYAKKQTEYPRKLTNMIWSFLLNSTESDRSTESWEKEQYLCKKLTCNIQTFYH